MVQTKAEIIENRGLLCGTYYQLSLKAPKIAHLARPGQFVHIKVNDGANPLLRRPFSIHQMKREYIEILYKVVGKGTKLLSQREKGESLDIIGPLGNGYRLPDKKAKIILVAGGIGVASLYFLAEQITPPPISGGFAPLEGEPPHPNPPPQVGREKGRGEDRGRGVTPFTILIGGKSKQDILCLDKFRKLGGKLRVSTEDGSSGRKGLVTDLLEDLLFTLNSQLLTVVYACGPIKMLKEITKIAKRYKIFCQVSLEKLIACGVGACQGCVVKAKDGYKRVCKDGPVFNSEELIW